MISGATFGFALEYVSDISAARRFYVDVLGLKVEREHPVFIQFDRFAIATDESMSGTRYRELYWVVGDAEAAFREVDGKATVTMPLKQMPFGKVFGIKGPAGEPCFLVQFAHERPSRETEKASA